MDTIQIVLYPKELAYLKDRLQQPHNEFGEGDCYIRLIKEEPLFPPDFSNPFNLVKVTLLLQSMYSLWSVAQMYGYSSRLSEESEEKTKHLKDLL